MNIYGFSATVQKEGSRGYVARIKELHANTQGRTMSELKRNIKDVAKLMILDVLEHEKLYSKATVQKARTTVIRALA
jgi:predicted RNase H-like HicB family nuclease